MQEAAAGVKTLVGSVSVGSSQGGYSGEPVPKNGRVHFSTSSLLGFYFLLHLALA